MSAEGVTYVEVEGEVVGNGLNTLNISGDDKPDEGEEPGRYWLHWSYDETGEGGFTGRSWFWDTPNNYFGEAWEIARIELGYGGMEYAGETGFKRYLQEKQPENLDKIFEHWTDKGSFAVDLIQKYGEWGEGGCVELT